MFSAEKIRVQREGERERKELSGWLGMKLIDVEPPHNHHQSYSWPLLHLAFASFP